MSNLTQQQIGRIGEYSVAAELEARGYATTLTLNNMNHVDIFGINDEGRQIAVQVKTTTKQDWVLNDISKIPKEILDKIVFIFVKIDKNMGKEYHIVKGKNVNEGTSKTKPVTWKDKDNKYLDKWNNLQKIYIDRR